MNVDDTYDEVRSGVRLVLSFDANANGFVGSMENTTSGQLTRARVEVHLDNGTELGPTTPVDLAPGQFVAVNLPSTAAPFQTWTAHPEVGSDESGGEHGGSEGGGETAAGAGTNLTTSGISRGVFSGPVLQADDSYGDKLNDLEFALAYDPASGLFDGRLKNEATEGLCDSRIKVIFDGNRTNSQSVVIPSLAVRERATFTLTADDASFTTWEVETETFICNNTTAQGGEGEGSENGEGAGQEGGEGSEGGSEGSGEHGGSQGSGEHGGSEGSGEGGGDGQLEGEGPVTPIDQASVTIVRGFDLNIAYDQSMGAFTGEMTNVSGQDICVGRVEIHVTRDNRTIELGPTVDQDWAPGQTRNVVIGGFDPVLTDTWFVHPEVAPCP